jgi:hypothetical protein
MRLARSLLRFLFCLADVRPRFAPRPPTHHALAVLLFGAVTLLGSAARAQTVRWEPADDGTPNAVQLVYENCAPEGEPQLPSIPGVSFNRIGQTTSTNVVNFKMTRSVILTYQVRGRQAVAIPAFNVNTDKGSRRVEAFTIAAPAPPLESVANAKLVPERTTVWAGEVFGLTYELSASRRTNPQISPTFDWNAAPLVAEDWTRPEITEALVNSERRVNVVFRTRVVSKTPNTFKLAAATHLLSIQTGTIGFGIISQPRMETVSVTSDQPSIEVRPLPTAPPGFSGAIGQFKLTSKIVPEKAAVGEPVTWTLELSGTGNWPDIAGLPSREVSTDFQVVQPKAKRTPAEGKLFDVTLAEDVVLVPTKAGDYTLGPVNFNYFDPKSGTYKTITAPRTRVTITAPAAPQFNTGTQTARPDPEGAPDREPKAPAAPVAPTSIPRDPLPGSAAASTPLADSTMLPFLVSPGVLLLAFWLWLAVRRAKQTDPVRSRREARDRLARTLSHLQSAAEPDRPSLLLAWQHDTAVLWQLSQAAPAATAFAEGPAPSNASSNPSGTTAAASDKTVWATLWAESDRALYGAKSALPTDWVARAQAALAAKRVPGFQPMRLFLPQNLMPFAAMVAVLFVATAAVVRAVELDALAAYRKADFPTAEKAWRVALEKTPTDWIARHNLSLTLAQQDRATEAAAQASAAFVQQPNNASVRWHFALAAEKAAAAPAVLASFIAPGPLQFVGRLASPAIWQRVLIAAVWAAAIAIGGLLLFAYGRGSRASKWTTLSLLVASAIIAGAAITGVHAYGVAAHSDSVIVARAGTLRSIPTEAEATQKTSPLAAGTLALVSKTFLGWTQLSFENGQTGWVRKEEVVPLWK